MIKYALVLYALTLQRCFKTHGLIFISKKTKSKKLIIMHITRHLIQLSAFF